MMSKLCIIFVVVLLSCQAINGSSSSNTPDLPSFPSSLLSESTLSDTSQNFKSTKLINMGSIIDEFAENLFQTILQNTDNGTNIVFSPLSIQVALSLLYCGAKQQTADALKTGLQLENFATPKDVADNFYNLLKPLQSTNTRYGNAVLQIANAIYVKDGYAIREKFRQIAVDSFYSQVANVNFTDQQKAAQTINNWVSNETHGNITDLIKPSSLTNDTGLVLVNTIYFNGFWRYRFYYSQTNTTSFYTNLNSVRPIKMMNQETIFEYLYMDDYKVKVIKLPYNNSPIAMLVLLPDDYNGIAKLQTDMQSFNFTHIMQQLETTIVTLSLPRFTIDFDVDLEKELEQLGMGIIFDENKANFDGILKVQTASGGGSATPQPTYVGQVRHKAHIEVNEKGTIAAAATEVRMIFPHAGELVHGRRAVFNANHSFVFVLINEYTSEIFFTGRFKG